MLTVPAKLRTMIVVFVPARLMHHMFALGHDLIAVFEGCLTEITGLVDIHISNAHVNAPDILHHIFTFEQQIADVRYCKLEYHINKHEYE